jgi:hypothetical protein
MWGNGLYNPRPDHPEDFMDFSNFRPKLIKPFSEVGGPNLVDLAFGTNQGAGLDDRGKLWVWKQSTVMGYKQEGDNRRDVTALEPRTSFKSICWTGKGGILFALDSSG